MRWTDVLLCASFFAWGAFIVPWLAFRWELRAWRKSAEESPGQRGAVIPASRPRNLRGPRALPGAPLGDPERPGGARAMPTASDEDWKAAVARLERGGWFR